MSFIKCSNSRRRKYSFWSDRGVAGPRPLPVFGNSLPFMLRSTAEVDVENCRKYGRLYGLYEGTTPILVVHDADLLQAIFTNHFSSISNRLSDEDASLDAFHAKNHIYANGSDGKHFRQTVSRCMANSWLKEVCSRINTDGVIATIRATNGKRIRLYDLLGLFCFHASAYPLFGLDFSENQQLDRIIHEMEKLGTASSPFTELPYTRYWLSARLPALLCRALGLVPQTDAGAAFFREMIGDLIEERSKGGPEAKQKDMAQAFADAVASGTLTKEQVVSTSVAIIGQATGVHLDFLCFLFYALSQSPSHQQLVQQEIDQHVDGEMSFESFSRMEYLSAVIFETLRLYPLELRAHRHVSAKEGVTIAGTDIHLPYGSVIHVPIYALSRDAEYWKDAESFDPSRFLPQNKDQLTNCAFMSFGAGPRICPGVRMSLFMLKRMIVPILRCSTACDATPKTLKFPPNSRKASDAARQIAVRFVLRS